MPQNIQIGLLALGGVLVLIGIVGGNIKIFGAEAAAKVSNPFLRFIAFAFGTFLIVVSVLFPYPQNSTENKIVVDPSLSAPSPIPDISIKEGNLVEVIPDRNFLWSCKGTKEADYDPVGPGGHSGYRTDERAMLPDAPFCSLIGRVGTGAWHYLGGENTFTADSSGGLYLTANDVKPGDCPLQNKQECYSDNITKGSTVTVNVRE